MRKREGDVPAYLLDGVLWDSNSGVVNYLWGKHPQLVDFQFREGVKEVVREFKRGNVLSQKRAIEIAYEASECASQEAIKLGKAIHKAAEMFSTNQPVPFLTPIEQKYFDGFLRCYQQNGMSPILAEKQLRYTLPDGRRISTRPDYYGPVNGVLAVVNYKTSRELHPDVPLQLACEAHLLRMNGYPVEKMYAMHIAPGFSYLIEYTLTWDDYLIAYNANYQKRQLNHATTYIRENEETAPPKIEETVQRETIATRQAQESEPLTTPLGLEFLQVTAEPSPTTAQPGAEQNQTPAPRRTSPHQEAERPDETELRPSRLAELTSVRQKAKRRGTRATGISSRKTDSRPRTPTEVSLDPKRVKLLSTAKRPRALTAYESR